MLLGTQLKLMSSHDTLALLIIQIKLPVYVLPLILQLCFELVLKSLSCCNMLCGDSAEGKQISHLRGCTVNPPTLNLFSGCHKVCPLFHEYVKLIPFWIIRLRLVWI
jgi:hypothetical protein